MSPLMLLGLGTVAVVVATSRRAPQRVAPLELIGAAVQVQPGEAVTGAKRIFADDRWSLTGSGNCPRGRDQSLPIVGIYDAIPEPLRAGPIGATISGGIALVQSIFSELGWRRVCTVLPGSENYQQIEAVAGTAADVWVQIETGFEGGPPVHRWTFRDDAVNATGRITERGDVVLYEPGPRSRYLATGGTPPGNMWPHVAGIGRYRSSVPTVLDQPYVDLVRTDNYLRLNVWLPPRAPASHLTNFTQRYRIDDRVWWDVEWSITPT